MGGFARDEADWTEYYEAMESRPLHPTYDFIKPFLEPGQKALELGCGIGHGAIYLSEVGLEVTAVDAFAEALRRLRRRMPEGMEIETIQGDFRTLSFEPDSFDVLIAGFCLFFMSPEDFTAFWPKLVSWIKPGGLFMGQILGVHDTWADREGHNAHTSEEVKSLLQGFEIVQVQEDERDGETAVGTPKHWHVFHVLARKR